MSTFANKRLSKELLQLEKNTIPGITFLPPDDIMTWYAMIQGPPDTPYEKGTFKIRFRFNDDYPVKSPIVDFITPMYHPNIYRDGKICVDILQSEWSPAQNIRTVLLSIMSLLSDPNPASPANRDAAILYNTNRDEYNKMVREFVEKHLNLD
jgi:ubiquitin-conjugating enzyme E2 A